jgi:hypothetical protein
MPLTKLDVDQLPNVNLNRYSTLILVNGNYWTFERNNHQNRTMGAKRRYLNCISRCYKMAKYSQTNRTDFKTNKDEAKTLALRKRMILEVRN